MARQVAACGVAFVAAAAAGCGSGGTPGNPSATRRAGPAGRLAPATTLVPGGTGGAGYGVPATRLAAEVPGCTGREMNVHGDAGLGLPYARRLMTHALFGATCTLQGRSTALPSYASRQDEAEAAAVAYEITAYFAAGPGWLAVPLDLSEPVGQQSVVQDVALALHGTVQVGAHAPRASATGG